MFRTVRWSDLKRCASTVLEPYFSIACFVLIGKTLRLFRSTIPESSRCIYGPLSNIPVVPVLSAKPRTPRSRLMHKKLTNSLRLLLCPGG